MHPKVMVRLALSIIVLWLLLLVAAEPLVEVGIVSYEGKQVGFLAAPNWLLNPLVTVLLAVVLALFLREVERLGSALDKAHMILHPDDLKPASDTPQSWRRLVRKAKIAWIVLSVLAFGASILEWYKDSYQPLVYYSSASELLEAEPQAEIDWSVGKLIDEKLSKNRVLAFSFAAFCLQGLMLSAIAAFLALTVSFAAWVLSFVVGNPRRVIVPDLKSEDLRRGFERFEQGGVLILIASLCIFVAVYFTLVQNIFLARHSQGNVFVVMASAITAAKTGDFKELITPEVLVNYSSVFAYLCGFVVIVLIFAIVPVLILGAAAIRAKGQMAQILDRLAPNKLKNLFPGSSAIELRARLEKMKTWPYHYFSLNTILVTTVILVATLFWPEIAFFLYVSLLVALITRIVSKINGLKMGGSGGVAGLNTTGAGQPRSRGPQRRVR